MSKRNAISTLDISSNKNDSKRQSALVLNSDELRIDESSSSTHLDRNTTNTVKSGKNNYTSSASATLNRTENNLNAARLGQSESKYNYDGYDDEFDDDEFDDTDQDVEESYYEHGNNLEIDKDNELLNKTNLNLVSTVAAKTPLMNRKQDDPFLKDLTACLQAKQRRLNETNNSHNYENSEAIHKLVQPSTNVFQLTRLAPTGANLNSDFLNAIENGANGKKLEIAPQNNFSKPSTTVSNVAPQISSSSLAPNTYNLVIKTPVSSRKCFLNISCESTAVPTPTVVSEPTPYKSIQTYKYEDRESSNSFFSEEPPKDTSYNLDSKFKLNRSFALSRNSTNLNQANVDAEQAKPVFLNSFESQKVIGLTNNDSGSNAAQQQAPLGPTKFKVPTFSLSSNLTSLNASTPSVLTSLNLSSVQNKQPVQQIDESLVKAKPVQLMSFNFNLQSNTDTSSGPKILNIDNSEPLSQAKTSNNTNSVKPTKLFSSISTNTDNSNQIEVNYKNNKIDKIDSSTSTDDFIVQNKPLKNTSSEENDCKLNNAACQQVKHKFLTEISNQTDFDSTKNEAVQVYKKKKSKEEKLEQLLRVYLTDELKLSDLFTLKRKLVDLVLMLDSASKASIQRNRLTWHNSDLYRSLNHRLLNDSRFTINIKNQNNKVSFIFLFLIIYSFKFFFGLIWQII